MFKSGGIALLHTNLTANPPNYGPPYDLHALRSPNNSRDVSESDAAQIPQEKILMFPPFLARTPYTKHGTTAGWEGTRVWDTSSRTEYSRPAPPGERGITSSLLWVRQKDQVEEILWFGTQKGFVCAWRCYQGKFEEVFTMALELSAEITCLAYDSVNNRLALGTRRNRVQSWSISAPKEQVRWTAELIFDIELESPGAIDFHRNMQEPDRLIYVYISESPGRVWTLNGEDGTVRSSWDAGAGIGFLAPNVDQGVFGLGDMQSGPAIYRYRDNFRWADRGTTIVSGSDHGDIYIFDYQTGERQQKVQVSTDGEWVQAVAVAEIEEISTIFAAQSRMTEGKEDIIVYKRLRAVGWNLFMERIFWPLMVLGFMIFFMQNFIMPLMPAGGQATAHRGQYKETQAKETAAEQTVWGRAHATHHRQYRKESQPKQTAAKEPVRGKSYATVIRM
ncbi:WD40 repeat-like protein [Mycena indigotica]|uniref:WD40 repeat-like protein n=1 Tax=Mycena indigotica TaxID=2126181 RepID=A0A8H6S5V7_9AGAR|nr:WD40 repeat-like protein [Mycena indigotica]KAF7293675.1 WD40 repeat-like protein [Mycena indigotica]